MQIITGIILGVLVSVTAWRIGSLSKSGAYSAAIVGGVIFGLGGLPWATLLLTFFISSSALSKAFKRQKGNLKEKFSKGNQRDWGQVLANGGLGAMLVIFYITFPGKLWIWFAYAGALAAVNADTWGTELGVLNPHPPRLITNGKIVEPGTSGAISLFGTLATLAGSGLIGLVGAAFPFPGGEWRLWIAATAGGFCGSLFDSLLGASIQAIYHCPQCMKDTERHPHHTCGTKTVQTRGWSWLNNDWVNFLASILGAIVAVLMWGLLR